MDNFIPHLAAVRTITLFSYMHALSDFLYKHDNETLRFEDKFKSKPVIRALELYMYGGIDDIHDRQTALAKKLIDNTDLYGSKESEQLDIDFVTTLFKYLIDSFFFDEFTNIYGFIAEVVRNKAISSDFSPHQVFLDINEQLINLKSVNQDGTISNVHSVRMNCVISTTFWPFRNYQPDNVNIFSAEYIYAYAGFIFQRFGKNTSIFSECQFKQYDTSENDESFAEYITIGIMIEKAVLAKKIDVTFLQIFALPALLYYVFKEKESLQDESIARIMSDRNHWAKAYELLFTHLNDEFESTKRKLSFQEARTQFLTNLSNVNSFERTFKDITDSYYNYTEEAILLLQGAENVKSGQEGKVIIKGYSGVINNTGHRIKQDSTLNYVFLIYFLESNKFSYYSMVENNTHFFTKFEEYHDEVDMDQFQGCAKNLDENFDIFASRIAKQKTDDYMARPEEFDWGKNQSQIAARISISKVPKSFEIKTLLKGMFDSSEKDVMMIKKEELLTKLFTASMFQNIDTVASRLLDPGYEYLFSIGKKGLESLKSLLPIAESRLKVSFEKLKQVDKVLSTTYLIIGNKNGRDLFVQSSFKNPDSGFGIVFLKLDDGRRAELRDSKFLVLNGITESNIKVYNFFDEITGVIENDAVIVRDSVRYNFSNNDFSFAFEVNKTLVEDICDFESNSFSKCPSLTQLTKDKDHLKNLYKKQLNEALNDTNDKVTFILSNYFFDDDVSRSSFLTMHTSHIVWNWFSEYKVEDPEMYYKLRYSIVMDVTEISIKSEFERIDKLYDPDELKSIRSDVYMQNVRQQFTQSKANYYVTYEDYFALRNFNREEWIKWNADSGKRIGYALYRLGIRQFDDPSEEYTYTLYYNRDELLPRNYFLENFVSKVSSTYELKKIITAYETQQPRFNDFQSGSQTDVSVNFKIIFHEKYFRADLSRVFKNNNGKVVLFPGCKFEILVVKRDSVNNAQIIMRYLHNEYSQYYWLKKALRQVNEFKNSNTRFSIQDPPKKNVIATY